VLVEHLDLRVGQQLENGDTQLFLGQRAVLAALQHAVDAEHGFAVRAQMQIRDVVLLHDFQEGVDTGMTVPVVCSAGRRS